MTFQEIISKLPKAYYQDESVYIINADCREVLPLIPDKSIDLVLTDPPYGINIVRPDGKMGGTSKDLKRWRGQINPQYLPVTNDDKPIDPTDLLRISQNQIIWGGNYIADLLPVSRCWLIWYKRINGQSNDFGDCELAWASLDKPPKVFQYLWMGMLRDGECGEHFHPTQKPVALLEWAGSQLSCETMIDPYMGGGSTIIAAKKLGRKCIGIEIEEKYCEIAAKRCSQSVMNLEIPKVEPEQPEFINFDSLPPNP